MSLWSETIPRLGLGTLTLCGADRPDPLEAQNLILFALREGIRIFDTADSYCRDESDFHYGEHLLRQAVSAWRGPREQVLILTKTGMIRPRGKWVPCGRPEHIRASVEQSLKALDAEQIFLLQLHVRDPAVPFEETLQCLAELQAEGKVQHLGLCNTTVPEIEFAGRYFTVAAVQNELSLQQLQSAANGTLHYSTALGLPFLAYRPLGGKTKKKGLQKSLVLGPLAERHQSTQEEIALAALVDAAPNLVPLVGATRLASLKSSLRALSVSLDISDRTALSLEFSFQPTMPFSPGHSEQSEPAAVHSDPIADPGRPSPDSEIVILMGIQGAGKSELVREFSASGYARLNRDELGGTLESLIPRLEQLLDSGHQQIVLDNTYATAASRRSVIEVGRRRGIPVRCCLLDTPLKEAWHNICLRMISRYGMPLGPTEMSMFRKMDPNLPPPQALGKWVQQFERPSPAEGFSRIETVPFQRRSNRLRSGKGLLLDVDGTLRITRSGAVYPRSAEDVVLLPGRREVLRQWQDKGYQLFFVSNQSGIAAGHVSHQAVQAAMYRTAELLEVAITEIVYCSHPSNPVGCYCRKPMPGLGVYLLERHQLDPAQTLMVGDRDSDAGFAQNLGVRYTDAADFFGTE